MNCPLQNLVSLICISPHKCQCQRKPCVECQYVHGVDVKQTVPIDKFEEMIMKKVQKYNLEKSSEITKQSQAFKQMLSQTEKMLKEIWAGLSQSIKLIYDQIEKEDQSFNNLINKHKNYSESTYDN